MSIAIALFLLLAQVFGLAAAPAAITGFVMRNGGQPPRGFAKAFKSAYPAWLISLGVLALIQWVWVSILGRPMTEVPSLVMLGVLVCGAYGGVYFVRAATPRP